MTGFSRLFVFSQILCSRQLLRFTLFLTTPVQFVVFFCAVLLLGDICCFHALVEFSNDSVQACCSGYGYFLSWGLFDNSLGRSFFDDFLLSWLFRCCPSLFFRSFDFDIFLYDFLFFLFLCFCFHFLRSLHCLFFNLFYVLFLFFFGQISFFILFLLFNYFLLFLLYHCTFYAL